MFIYVHGNSQSGKSSFIKTMFGKKAEGVVVGSGDGRSTTGSKGEVPPLNCMKMYQQEVCLQDTIGFDDTQRKHSN